MELGSKGNILNIYERGREGERKGGREGGREEVGRKEEEEERERERDSKVIHIDQRARPLVRTAGIRKN